jgi:hypothetical protein
LLASLKKGVLETIFKIWQIIPLILSVKLLTDGPGACVPEIGECDLEVSTSMTASGYRDEENMRESWGQVPRANGGMW